MADLPQQNTIVQYLADGITTTYVVPFYTPVETDGTPNIDVFTQLASAIPVPAADINEPNVDYIYTPNLDPITGGTITFQFGHIPPNGYAVTIVRNIAAALDVEFSQAQTFSGYTLDLALDKLLLISQQNKSYAFDRNLSYIVNSYLPDSTLAANVQIPILGDGQVWYGSLGGVIAVTLEQSSDTSTLRSELANNAPITDGARLVGYYDPVNINPTTVDEQLTLLTNSVVAPFPTGCIIDFGGTTPPAGFLICDGAAVSRTIYAELFDAIGTLWGIGDGSTTFNIPNLQGYVTAGANGSILSSNDVGDIGGEAAHVMLDSELVGHVHPFATANLTGTLSPTLVNSPAGATAFISPLGSNNSTLAAGHTPPTAFPLIQPTAIVYKIIKI